MTQLEKKRLQINVELQGDEVDRFLEAQEKLRMKTKAAAGYKLIMDGLDVIAPPPPKPETATAS